MALKAGDKAPQFKGRDQAGKEVGLSDFKGKKLILYFYPKDDTPGCTAESCNLRDHWNELQDMDFEVLGISADSEKKHQKFISKYNLPFRLIADTEKEIIESFGVWGRKKFMGREFDGIIRTTFIIDENGVITHIIDKVATKSHSEQIIQLTSK